MTRSALTAEARELANYLRNEKLPECAATVERLAAALGSAEERADEQWKTLTQEALAEKKRADAAEERERELEARLRRAQDQLLQWRDRSDLQELTIADLRARYGSMRAERFTPDLVGELVLRAERAEEALAATDQALREIASLPEWARNAPRIARAALAVTVDE